MLEYNTIYIVAGYGALVITIVLAGIFISKMQRVKELQTTVGKLQKSLDEMDEQAKLIVRTDIELNKTREELDKKLTGLYALQNLSRAVSTTLEENQIFKKIDTAYLEELGFEKALAFLWYEGKKEFLPYLHIGYSENEQEAINSFIHTNQNFFLDFIKKQKSLSSIYSFEGPPNKENINNALRVNTFVLSPILPKEGNGGFLFVGTENLETLITEGDEELINILANQLGQALENARLFEKTWRAQQDLEKKVEERTRALSQALNEVNLVSKRKTDFISSVSHELRTPLTSIKGYASILLAGQLGHMPEQIKERLAKINKHSDELVHMVNDLLDIARIESGKIVMKKEPQDLKEIVDEVLDLLSVQAKEKHVSLDSKIDENTRVVVADRSQIQRVFINLIGNALKFTPPKGKINIATRKTDAYIQVDVTDSGCGIPEEALDKVFEEFYRVDNPINQEVKGTGLGLSMVKHIVEAHGGKIWAQSKLNAGSTFSFTLAQAA